ncbi:FGGY family carbohydrate kinase [Streptomyces alboflavus]|nr:FGGY family carbohydrate kinase [Streptomyces alboflavus]
MSVLAIDVGTTMIKSVVFDDQGGELAVSRLETEVQRRHPGWAEQDMDTVWNAVVYTVRTALSALAERPGPADPVWLVTFTAQGDGAWLVDAAGRPTGPAILWSDGRAGDLLTRWERAGVLEEAFRRNGSLTCSGMPNAVISWLDTHDPDRLARSSACLTAAGWLFHHLTGVTAIDESDASAPFLDHATGDYDPGIVDLFGLAAHARLLPKVLGEDERIAEITADAAAQLGVQPGLPVVMAPTTSPPPRAASASSTPARRAASSARHCARRSSARTSTPPGSRPASTSPTGAVNGSCAPSRPSAASRCCPGPRAPSSSKDRRSSASRRSPRRPERTA